jgi:hypothetical protein
MSGSSVVTIELYTVAIAFANIGECSTVYIRYGLRTPVMGA